MSNRIVYFTLLSCVFFLCMCNFDWLLIYTSCVCAFSSWCIDVIINDDIIIYVHFTDTRVLS